MILGTLERAALLLVLWSSAGRAAAWRWPDSQAEDSVRIDAKVGFVDEPTNRRNNRDNVQADELFQQPSDTAGFYNRPPGAGRYPARGDDPDIRINGRPAYNDGGHRNEKYQDGTLDSLQYCKCVSTPDCEVRTDYANACGAHQYLCCYKVPEKQNGFQSEYFNEVEDERPALFPGRPNKVGPFSTSNFDNNIFGPGPGVLVGPGGPTGVVGPQNKPVLVGPDGPTGVIGPQGHTKLAGQDRPVLVGPGGPTGVIGPGGPTGVTGPDRPVLVGPGGPTGLIGPGGPSGPTGFDRPTLPRGPTGAAGPERPILVGPGGPTGVIGPNEPTGPSGAGVPERPVLVGPGGPTGIIGPSNEDHNDNLLVRPLDRPGDIRQSESAQRGVLVGPGGPTGIIGPAFNRPNFFGPAFNRPILVGPSGPTGFIGPRLVGPGGPTGIIGPDFSRQARGPGVLVGPGGPTGTIGPGRQVLVGPRGPTGRIGPRNFFGK